MITKVFCSRSSGAHQIAGITADADGLLLTYRSTVHTSPTDTRAMQSPQDGYYYLANGAECEQRPPVGEILEVDLWCVACKTGHPVDVGKLFDAARNGRKKITLTSRGAEEGHWQI